MYLFEITAFVSFLSVFCIWFGSGCVWAIYQHGVSECFGLFLAFCGVFGGVLVLWCMVLVMLFGRPPPRKREDWEQGLEMLNTAQTRDRQASLRRSQFEGFGAVLELFWNC